MIIGVHFLSDITEQFYCEKKLELGFEYPSEPNEAMKNGTAGHENATELFTPVGREQAFKDAVWDRTKIAEFNIAWEHNGVLIRGQPDEVWFSYGKVDLVCERKFSNSLIIYNDYHVQTQLYCQGLQEMGFDLNNADYSIAVFQRGCGGCPELMLGTCGIFRDDRQYFRCEYGACISKRFKFQSDQIIHKLNWALEYWTGKRKAIPINNRNKCRNCDHSGVCESSLS